ncbi:FAD-binding oxidoreductase [Orrella sp. JC864]|uniref:NAD(P)/FAD-dependent oxidoreductase n=1 Tax=Orrella sp. JC864 TaxID=3120298 RepID=UPI00300863AF
MTAYPAPDLPGASAHPPSVWNATAPAGVPLPPLAGDAQADCVVIGGGFTGLNAAWQLARRGVQPCVLEAHDAGWGASGRNGGMAVLRYKHNWSTLARKLGHEQTLLLHRLVHQALDILAENVQELGLDGGFSRCGHITAAYTSQDAQALREDVAWLAEHAGDRVPRFLDAGQAAALIGSRMYRGGYLDERAAGIHPLRYTRELAAALVRRGIAIHAGTPALRVHSDAGGCIVHTPHGQVRARSVIVASSAYTDLFDLPDGLRQRIVPVTTSVIATEPLPDDLYASVLGQGHLVTDTRHLVNYFRRVPGQRVLFGGRGSMTGRERPAIYRNLGAGLHALFPQLCGVPLQHQWSGKVAVTLDDFPHVCRYDPRIVFAFGFGGRGVALSHLLGRLAAELALGGQVQAGPMGRQMPVLPLHGLRLPVLNLMAAYYKLRDRMRT